MDARLLQEFALYNLQMRLDIPLQRVGFAKAIRAHEFCNDSILWEEVRFYPDAFSFLEESKELLIFEIEDTSRLTVFKIQKLYWFSEAMFDVGWRLKVFVADRYGFILNEIPVDYFEWLNLVETQQRNKKKYYLENFAEWVFAHKKQMRHSRFPYKSVISIKDNIRVKRRKNEN